MSDMGIIREALWKVSHQHGCAGTHDGDLISNALRDVVMEIEEMVAKKNREKDQ